MSLYDDWKQLCETERSEAEYKKFWNGYFDKETAAYEKILGSGNNKISGTLKELADGFDMDVCEAVGFLDGINTSLEEELKLEELEADKPVEAVVDFEKLYLNMLRAKAPWLYSLKEWDGILTTEKRHAITKAFHSENTFVKEKTVGRNDPCPCGSGKKYKNCCGKNK